MKHAIVFPGLGYGADRPLLYYAGKLAVAAGYGLVKVAYGELPRVERPSVGKALDVEALERCFRLALERAFVQLEAETVGGEDAGCGGPSDILIISKSIGTVVGAAWAASKNIAPRQILYTPVAKTFEFPLADCIAFHGTADPWLGNDEFLELCHKTSVGVHVFDNANHSLECGDVARDISYLGMIMQTTESFIGGRAGQEKAKTKTAKSTAPLPRFSQSWHVLQGREDEEMLREKTSGWSSRRDSRGDYDASDDDRD